MLRENSIKKKTSNIYLQVLFFLAYKKLSFALFLFVKPLEYSTNRQSHP